jgi:hypothetical protein
VPGATPEVVFLTFSASESESEVSFAPNILDLPEKN